MTFYFLLMAIPFLIALIITPMVRRAALRFGVFAVPNHRSMHNGKIPKLGGAAMFLSFVSAAILCAVLFPDRAAFLQPLPASLLLGVTILMILGSFDDKYDLNCNLKLFVEISVSLIAVAAGWRIDTAILPGVELDLGWLAWPLTILWIVGVTNAINMIDGLDGLAGGISLVVSAIAMAVAGLYGNHLTLLVASLLIGSVAGFLRYNIHPAKIFMGDSGSLPLGFALACLSIQSTMTVPGKAAVIVPLLMLSLPLTDTLLAIIRRIRRGIHPFHADREHIHHRLVKLGLSHGGAALFMVGLSMILAVLAFLMAQGMLTNLRLFESLSLQ